MTMRFDFLYKYRAFVVSVYDGDTITVDIDLGFNVWKMAEKIRLYGIDTPEIRGEEREDGLIAKDWLESKIKGKEIILETVKDRSGKYGRMLGIIWYDGDCINDLLVEEELAEVY